MPARLSARAHGLPVVARCAAAAEALRIRVGSFAPDEAEAVVIGGNGFRAVGVIEALEAAPGPGPRPPAPAPGPRPRPPALGRPVLTADQVLLRAALRAAGAATAGVEGCGRLFADP
ncbi:hypothetical protein [Streptomyces sp. NBC_01233]|uniref:hypothetical protein n=1 Tax=Streptomyces sp. NBC_01233 TaxID=2903787 RepID=UPI002E156726|nr:hypothetical protein OG332_18940 [Streptomyces sp. NBC_01233]